MLHDSNRPLRLAFYPSLRPEKARGTPKSLRALTLAAELVHPWLGSVLFSDLSTSKKIVP